MQIALNEEHYSFLFIFLWIVLLYTFHQKKYKTKRNKTSKTHKIFRRETNRRHEIIPIITP